MNSREQRQFQFSFPFRDGHSFAVECNQPRCSSIVSLFSIGRPFAVFRRIRTIVVNAVEGATFWSLSHVFVKIFKLLPAVTDCDTSSSIVSERFVFFVEASSNHAVPQCVYKSPRFSVFYTPSASPTPAGRYLTSRDFLSRKYCFCPTVTYAKPSDLIRRHRFSNYRQLSKLLTGVKYFLGAHGEYFTPCSTSVEA